VEIAIILSIIFMIFLMVFIKKIDDLFLLLMSSVFLINWIADELYLIPHFFTWCIEFIIGILFLNYLLPKIVFLKKINLKPFGKYIILLFLYSLIGSLTHFVNFSDIALGFRALFKYLFLFIIFINSNFSQKSYKKFFTFWLILMGIQPFVGSYQYLIEGSVSDPVSGTLLSTGFASILLIVFIICLIDLINQKKVNNFIIYIFIFLSATIIPIFGEAKAFFYFLPLAFFIRYINLILSFKIFNILKLIFSLIVGIYLIQTIFFNVWKVELFNFGGIDSSDFLFSQGSESVTTSENPQATLAISISERYLAIMAVYNFLNEDKSRIFFGDGLGSNIFTYESRQDLTRKQIGGISTQEDYLKKFTLGKIIQNIGVIGFLLFCLLLLIISIYSYRASLVIEDNFFKKVYQILPAFSLLFFISIFYSDPFEDSIAFSYWFFVSSLNYLPQLRKINYLK